MSHRHQWRDRDASELRGVGVARYRAGGTFIGAEKVRTLDSDSAMDQAITRAKRDLVDGGCAGFLAGTAPNVEATTSVLGEATGASGSGYLMVRIDSRTKDGASAMTEWVAFGWHGSSRTVWTVVLDAPLDQVTGQQEITRLANLATTRIASQVG